MSARGLVLFAHGSSDPRWAAPLERIAARVREARPGLPVALAFLERMTPSLATATRALADAGCMRVDVVPVFLGMGGHLRDDLPPLVQAAAAALPAVDVRLHGALGERDDVIAALAAAALAAGGFTE